MNRLRRPARFRRRALAAAASALCLLPALGSWAAEPGPAGVDFQVSTLTTSVQRDPAIAIDADGDFVVVWSSGSGDGAEIRARRYNAAGLAQGAEIVVNVVTAGSASYPAVAMNAAGDFVVAWQAFFTGRSTEIRARRYNAAGVAQGGPLSPEIAVNTVTTGSQIFPDVAMDAAGDFVVAWSSSLSGGNLFEDSDFELRARRYNAAGVAQGGEIAVSTATTADNQFAAVALDADGDFVVAWQFAALGQGIRARRYDAAGLARGPDFAVNTETAGSHFRPDVAADADGDFVVSWSNYGASTGIRAQRYSATGLPLGGEFVVNTETFGSQRFPAVATDADGDFVIAWESGEFSDSTAFEIRAQRYSGTGEAQGGEIQVSGLSRGIQSGAAIALDADGDFVLAWNSGGGLVFDIRARRYQGPDPVDLVLFQTDSADPAPVGSVLSYTLSVGNLHAPVAPTGIAAIDEAIGLANVLRVVDVLPQGSTGVSASGSNWTCALPAGRVICDYSLPLAAASEASPITVSLTPPNSPGVVLSNVVRVSASQFDENLLNNREVERTRLSCAESLIQFSASSYGVAENSATGTLSAVRTGGACGAATVQFDTGGGSATPGLDYSDVTGTLSWADGETGSKSFTVPINNDALDEIDERVLLSLSGVRGASLGTRSAARLNILDDDPAPRINFSSSGQTVIEAVGLVNVSVVLSRVSGRDVVVPVSAGGTATADTDYFADTAQLTIPAGQTSATAQIEVVNDSATEATETVVLSLGTPLGAALGSQSSYTLSLTDDDVAVLPTVSFTTVSGSGDETLTRTALVQLSAASAQTITVPFSLGGTATQGGDYSLNRSSPLTFNPGVTQIGIQTVPVNDTLDEPNETVVLTLGAPTNASLGANTGHTRTIVDNDP